LLSSNGYFEGIKPPHGLFEGITFDNVVLFQLQHIYKDGQQLKPDGVVGTKTWWALKNPSGEKQRNHISVSVPSGLTTKRHRLVELIIEEHSKPVFEVPDGSNRSSDIDNYWGDTGVIGFAWCCAFVSWALKEVTGTYPIEGKHHLGVQRMWRAAKRLDMETNIPKPGDIFVQIFSGGKGHTGFVVAISEDGKSIYTGEGNSGNRLKIGKRPISPKLHFIDCFQDNQSLEFERFSFNAHSTSNDTTR
jgi:hypothetical protein